MVARGIAVDEAGRLVKRGPDAAAGEASLPARSVWDGAGTAAQVARGREVYARACSPCHLDSLAGDAVSPPLLGPSFVNRYAGSTAHDMISALRSSMPQNAPDSLGDQAYVDLAAFLLRVNGAADSSSELPIDVNALMRLTIPPPAAAAAPRSGR